MPTNRPDADTEDTRTDTAATATGRPAAPPPAPATQGGGQEAPAAQDADHDEHPDALTVVITRGGRTIECDDWSEANNLITSGGCSVKDGYPRTRDEAMARAKKIAERRQAEQAAERGATPA